MICAVTLNMLYIYTKRENEKEQYNIIYDYIKSEIIYFNLKKPLVKLIAIDNQLVITFTI